MKEKERRKRKSEEMRRGGEEKTKQWLQSYFLELLLWI